MYVSQTFRRRAMSPCRPRLNVEIFDVQGAPQACVNIGADYRIGGSWSRDISTLTVGADDPEDLRRIAAAFEGAARDLERRQAEQAQTGASEAA